MKILGIDPGTLRCGYGLVETDGVEARALEHGVVRARGSDVGARLRTIYEGLLDVLRRTRPDVAAVESTFSGENARTALRIGEGRGVALLAAAVCDVPVVEYAPAEVKKAVVGTGRAQKTQVLRMVASLLALAEGDLSEDSADALGIALCHAFRAGREPNP